MDNIPITLKSPIVHNLTELELKDILSIKVITNEKEDTELRWQSQYLFKKHIARETTELEQEALDHINQITYEYLIKKEQEGA